MPTEVVTITIGAGSANQLSKQVSINVDVTTGTGSTYFTYTGSNGGQDTIVATATIAGKSYTSNSAFVGWQPTNGAVSLLNNLTIVGCQKPSDSDSGWTGITGVLFGTHTNQNTVVVNQVGTNGAVGGVGPIVGIVTDDGNSGQYKHKPPMIDSVKSDGTALTPLGTSLGWGQGAAAGTDGGFTTFFSGSFVVSQAGTETFYFLVDDAYAFYMGGGTSVASGGATQSYGGSPAVPTTASLAANLTGLVNIGAWPLLSVRNTSAAEIQTSNYAFINFPAPGIYPFLCWWSNNNDAQTFFNMTYAAGTGALPPTSGNGVSGGVIKPVSPQPTPPTTTLNAHGLGLSLSQSNLQIQGQTMQVFVQITGVVYTSKQFIPVLENTSGKLFLYNNTNQFNFQTYNGMSVNKTAAAASVFSLSGDNTAWNGLLNVQYNNASDSNFSLVYGGANFPSGIAPTTQLTVQADDIAWFNSVNNSFDLFTPTSSGGGAIKFSIEVDWMVKPKTLSVSPSSIVASGTGPHIFTVTLDNPMPPSQFGANSITANQVIYNATATGGVSVLGTEQNFNAAGSLTGWNVTCHVPTSAANGTFNLNSVITGVLTYLNGTVFTTNSVAYLSTTNAITTTGGDYVAPVGISATLSAVTTPLPATETITGIAYTLDNNPLTMTFQYKSVSSGTTVPIGVGTLVTSLTGTLGGKTVYYKTYSITWTVPNGDIAAPNNVVYVGFSVKDTVSALTTQYFPITEYTLTAL